MVVEEEGKEVVVVVGGRMRSAWVRILQIAQYLHTAHPSPVSHNLMVYKCVTFFLCNIPHTD